MIEPNRAVFRTTDGLDLVADRYGRSTRGVVILAHGGGQTRHAWAKTAAALADRGVASHRTRPTRPRRERVVARRRLSDRTVRR